MARILKLTLYMFIVQIKAIPCMMELDKTMANEANKIIAASVHADTQMALSTPLQMNINQLKFHP